MTTMMTTVVYTGITNVCIVRSQKYAVLFVKDKLCWIPKACMCIMHYMSVI
jgi:hypothetical protein